ncbi:acyl-CoA dehydrogenase family protein [Actinokineospora pegani]|uniref:acyl-CoA dehydrogenase family protein n=1 Tax=Actinokineospora pegani TaxID=2654637 RepID=UPI0012E9FDA9|nr:acyl-CoA dehydrogenase family protein [Actinokineospora pegani]
MLSNTVLSARLTDEHRALATRASAYFTPDLLDRWRTTPGGHVRKELWRDMAEHGLLGVSLPREHGGQGLGLLGALVLGEAVAGVGDGGLALGLHVQTEIAADWLVSAADPGLRARHLPAVVSGESVACQCDTDPSAAEPTTATTDGDSVVVTGRKKYVVNGANADLCFVSAQLDGAPAIVLVGKDTPGVEVVEVHDKLGTRAIDSATVSFEGARVPRDQVVSRGGVSQLMRWNRVMSRMRFLIAADAWQLHRRLLDHIVGHTGGRELGGRPLAAWPVNAHALARARADQELMAAGVVDGYLRLTEGGSSVPEVAELKWFCVEKATELAALCTDLEGGAGYMWGSASLAAHAQARGFRMSGGSQTTMLTIANHSLACRAELAQPAAPVAPSGVGRG